jgi:uncharacterized protein (TIGR02186 family)
MSRGIQKLQMLLLCNFFLYATAAASAEPESLQTDISSHHIQIQTDFKGASVVVFGAIDNDRQAAKAYDIVVVVRAADEMTVARRKARMAGLWVNSDSMQFAGVPGFYAVLSTRPLSAIAGSAVLDANGIGFGSLPIRPSPDAGTQPESKIQEFRTALIALKQHGNLYRMEPSGVVFIGRRLFRTTMDLPSNVRTGEYTVSIFLFRDGKLLSTDHSTINIDKAGTGLALSSWAVNDPVLYGIASVLAAIAAGMAGSVLFRRY